MNEWMNECHDDDDDDGGGRDDDDDDDCNDEIVLSSSALNNAIYFAVQGGSNVWVCARNPARSRVELVFFYF